MEVVVAVDPAPDLGAELGRVLLDDVPESVVGVEDVGVDGGVGAELWWWWCCSGVAGVGAGAAVELQLEAAGHHGELPRPDDGAVVGGVCEVCDEDGFGGEGRVGDDEADRGAQAGGEGAQDVEGGLVEEGRQLGFVGGVEEEVAEAVVCVHDVDGLEVGVAVERKGVEGDVGRGVGVTGLAGAVVEG